MISVSVQELRQNLSRYLADVKEGESFVVTECGREVARLSPSDPPPAGGRPSLEILDELREDRV